MGAATFFSSSIVFQSSQRILHVERRWAGRGTRATTRTYALLAPARHSILVVVAAGGSQWVRRVRVYDVTRQERGPPMLLQ
jgi:hypothetical protein